MIGSIRPVGVDRAVFDVVGGSAPDGPILLRTRRDLDLVTVAAARAEMAALLVDRTTRPSVVLHLGRRCFVDMRGLRLLVDVAREVRRCGGDLTVVAAPPCLRSMVARLDLGDELPLAGRIGG